MNKPTTGMPAAGMATVSVARNNELLIPIDRELQEILVATSVCRRRLKVWSESVRDRIMYETNRSSVEGAIQDLENAMASISELVANQVAVRLAEDPAD